MICSVPFTENNFVNFGTNDNLNCPYVIVIMTVHDGTFNTVLCTYSKQLLKVLQLQNNAKHIYADTTALQYKQQEIIYSM